MKNRLSSYLSALLISMLFSSEAYPSVLSPDLEPLLRAQAADAEVSVIVNLSDRVNPSQYRDSNLRLRRTRLIRALRQKADTTQSDIKTFLANNKAKRVNSFWLFNGMAVTAKASVINALAAMPGVASIRPDSTVTVPRVAAAEAVASEWNLDMTNAPELWALGHTGSGVVVASMDTGVDPDHPDLKAKWRGGTNSWFDPNGQHSSPSDADGHGTQVMGIMVGGSASGKAIGVAPGAKWIAVKIFNDAGTASTSSIHAGFQWLLDPDGNPDTNDTPAVVNNSWGFDRNAGQCLTEFKPDIEVLKAAEIAVVFSAGNSGPSSDTSVSPANITGSIAVGAVDALSSVANFSSRGPSACSGTIYPHLSAPGVSIKTSDLTFGGAIPNPYASVNGTSFAAPHVTGAIALLRGVFPSATVSSIEDVLKDSAADVGALGPDNASGHGLVNVLGAYTLLSGPPPVCTDGDKDGFYAQADCGTPADCNDKDASVHPGAKEIPNDGIDQDCSGADLITCVDADGDGFYAQADCGTPVDCNDKDASIHPGAKEIPNDGIDQDCSGSDLITCVDADGDGFYAQADCGTPVDCNDKDASVYPGAKEIKHDGIDQDCNGYDLTIDIVKAEYRFWPRTLTVVATSRLGRDARLWLVGYGPMRWVPGLKRWEIFVPRVWSNPRRIKVRGVEGSVIAPTT